MRDHKHQLRPPNRRRNDAMLLAVPLALLGALLLTPAFAEQITANNADDVWGANNFTNHDGQLLWYVRVNGDNRDVWYYDGTAPMMIQAHDPNVPSLGLIADTVFGLGSGASPGQVVGAWRRGVNYAWVWTSGQAPVEIDTVAANLFDDPANPQPTNPEGVATADGCVFMIMQANAGGGVLPNHVFEIDPATGGVQTVSGSAAVNGVDEVRTSNCEAAWIFNPNDDNTITGLPFELQYFDGTTTVTLDRGPLSWSEIDFREGKIVYIKDVLEIPQVFLIDVSQPNPEPQQLSHGLRFKRNPQVDGSHVAWVELNDLGDSTSDIVLLGDHVVTSRADRAKLAGPFPFWLDSGQLVWRTLNDDLRTFLNNETLIGDVNVNHPRVSRGKIAWYGQSDDGGNDDEIFLNLDTTPTLGQPAPPMFVDAEAGNGKVTLRWDRVLGAESYNVYYAEEPGVSSLNYTSLIGGATLQNVQSPAVVDGLDNGATYYFTVTTVEDGFEGPDSGEATPRAIFVDSTVDAPDADQQDGLCLSTVGSCTLRAAIDHAGDLDDDRTIVLPAGTYNLTQGPEYALIIGDDMRIVGDGQGVSVISGDPSDQVIETTMTQNTGRLILRDLTIRDGIQGINGHFDMLLERVTLEGNGNPTSSWRGGGGSMKGINITLIDCLVANNQGGSHAGGVLFGGWPVQTFARVVRTEFRNNFGDLGGGGFYNITANVHLIDSEVHHNSELSFGGGGIWNEEQMTIVGSAIYANSTPNGGGGINSVDEIAIINSTISENHSDGYGGGISSFGPRLNLTNVTVADNTTLQASAAGLDVGGNPQLRVKHTIFKNAASKPNCRFNQGHDISEGYNLEDGDSCRFFEATDLVNTEPLLGPLADNGGLTPTHMLLAGSPAMDAGDPAGCNDPFGLGLAADQRGAMRPFDGDGVGGTWCDLGAVESLGACIDVDGDSFGSGLDPSCQVGPDADCDDTDGTVYPGAEQICDGVNNDCASPSWPALDGTNEVDGDGDGLSSCAGDCLDTNAAVWGIPGETRSLQFVDAETLSWSVPLDPGAAPATLRYDAIRAESAADLSVGAVCLSSDEPQRSAIETDVPGAGQAYYYLSRARNDCPSGIGSWGTTSAGAERLADVCP